MRIIPQRCDGGDKDHLFFISEGHVGNTAECPTCHKHLPLLPHEINYLDGTGPQIIRQLRCTICNRTKNVFEFPAIDQRNLRTGICVECTFLHHITEAITTEPVAPPVVKVEPKKLRRGWRLKWKLNRQKQKNYEQKNWHTLTSLELPYCLTIGNLTYICLKPPNPYQ